MKIKITRHGLSNLAWFKCVIHYFFLWNISEFQSGFNNVHYSIVFTDVSSRISLLVGYPDNTILNYALAPLAMIINDNASTILKDEYFFGAQLNYCSATMQYKSSDAPPIRLTLTD